MSLSPRVRAERRAFNNPKPDPDTLPRKRCKNCPKFFRVTKPNREFCSSKCRNEFHHHGSAYGQLKDLLQKQVEKWNKETKKELTAQLQDIRERLTAIESTQVNLVDRIEDLEAFMRDPRRE
jgi:collagenase-like PrtC family protease